MLCPESDPLMVTSPWLLLLCFEPRVTSYCAHNHKYEYCLHGKVSNKASIWRESRQGGFGTPVLSARESHARPVVQMRYIQKSMCSPMLPSSTSLTCTATAPFDRLTTWLGLLWLPCLQVRVCRSINSKIGSSISFPGATAAAVCSVPDFSNTLLAVCCNTG